MSWRRATGLVEFRLSRVLAALLLSRPYCMAMAIGFIEYSCWQWVLGDKANPHALARLGAGMMVAGEALRKIAMVRRDLGLLIAAQCQTRSRARRKR